MATCLVPRSKMRLPAADKATVADRGDWAGSRLTLTMVWGLPAAVMLLALLLNPVPRGLVWIFMLSWMGGACLENARRCERTHCRYTGPFFVGMAAAVLAYITGALPLGSRPWLVLGIVIALGNSLIWWVSERALGTYSAREQR